MSHTSEHSDFSGQASFTPSKLDQLRITSSYVHDWYCVVEILYMGNSSKIACDPTLAFAAFFERPATLAPRQLSSSKNRIQFLARADANM
jgi:hypothetical protein